MIQQVLNRQLLKDLLDSMEAEAKASVGERRRSVARTPMDEMSTVEIHDLLGEIGNAKKDVAVGAVSDRRASEVEFRSADLKTYIPRSPELSNLQSAVEQYFVERRPDVVDSADVDDDRRGPVPATGSRLTIWPEYLTDRRLFGAFEQTDIRWINSLFAKGIRQFRNKHDFVDHPDRKDPIPFADDKVRMIVFGDWGSGIPRARKMTRFMRRELDDDKVRGWQKHVIHLGDVYYSGWKGEYEDRFLKYWPVKAEEKSQIGSFTLNGNHDMFSGGWAYYDYALADQRFAAWQGKSSLFQLANSRWQIFGLDTAHDDAGLKDPQVDWIRRAARKGLKTIFLSHHQYCSSFETPAKTLVKKIEPVLADLPITAWLWGHEHRCMTYKNIQGIRFPRCLGHGGVPVYQTHGAGDPIPSPGKWEYRDYIDGGLELWAKFGFVVLDFTGEKIYVRYVDEDGRDVLKETIE